MEVHFTAEQEDELSRIAHHAGVDAERFVREGASRAVLNSTDSAPLFVKVLNKLTGANWLMTKRCADAHPLDGICAAA